MDADRTVGRGKLDRAGAQFQTFQTRVQTAVVVASAGDQVIDSGGQLGVARFQPIQFRRRRRRRGPRPPVGGGQALGQIGDPSFERGGRGHRLGLQHLQPIIHLALDVFKARADLFLAQGLVGQEVARYPLNLAGIGVTGQHQVFRQRTPAKQRRH